MIQSGGALVEEVVDPSGQGSGGQGQASQGESSVPEWKIFDSLAALEAADAVVTRCGSEVAGIDILKGKSGKIYLMSNGKKRIVPKHTLIGGFGAGKQLSQHIICNPFDFQRGSHLIFCFCQVVEFFFCCCRSCMDKVRPSTRDRR